MYLSLCEEECFHQTFLRLYSSCTNSQYRMSVLTFVAIQGTKSSGHRVETFHCFYRPSSRGKGHSTRWLSFRIAREILTHDGPGCGVREDDVGRRLAWSPEALLRQEAAGHIIPVARKVPLMPSAPSGLISPEPLSLSTSIRVAGLP